MRGARGGNDDWFMVRVKGQRVDGGGLVWLGEGKGGVGVEVREGWPPGWGQVSSRVSGATDCLFGWG